jgi:hypothetical protein
LPRGSSERREERAAVQDYFPQSRDDAEIKRWLAGVRKYAEQAGKFAQDYPELATRLLRLCDRLESLLSSASSRSGLDVADAFGLVRGASEIGALNLIVRLEEESLLDDAHKERRRVAAIPTKAVEDAEIASTYDRLRSEGRKSMDAKRVLSERRGCSVRAIELGLSRHRARMRRS